MLAIGDGLHWAGAEGWARHLLPGMRRSSKPRGERPGFVDEEEWRAWWTEGNAAWQRIEAEGVPIVRVVSDVGASPEGVQAFTREVVAAELMDDIGSEPWDLIALEVLSGDVALPGFVANPLAYMARAATFALSSINEGLPGVLIQAMACGCPVVSTDCPSGPAEILAGGRYGRLVPPGDDTMSFSTAGWVPVSDSICAEPSTV